MKFVVATVLVLMAWLTLVAGPAAAADPPLGLVCAEATDGSLRCGSDGSLPDPAPTTAATWDGTPIDVSVTLPDPATAGDGPYPLVMMFHGYSQGKVGFTEQKHYSDKGYAVFSMTARGFHNSCGNAATSADPACAGQYVRLIDTRFEVRDAQFFAGQLVDQGWVRPDRIAAYGGSYGGGMSMTLAALKDRTMLPDGTLVPWTSPGGEPLSLAVATPLIPWTDLAYAQVPNGRNLDYLTDNAYDTNHFGVVKQSLINGLFRSGSRTGRYAPARALPAADLAGWLDLIDRGEPFQGNPAATGMIDELTRFHSSYYVPATTSPAPLLIFNGITDDLFPADEALRFYNRSRELYPDAAIGLMFGDLGHQRSQNKAEVGAALGVRIDQWIDHYLGGIGAKPAANAVVYTETCPKAAPSGGPVAAADWASLSPGEIVIEGGASGQTISPDGGDPGVANAFNPVLGPGACASPPGAIEAGTVNLASDPAPAGGFTVLGSPTVIAKISVAGSDSQVAARLVDLAPDGTKKLVARQLYRPGSGGYQVFQLHPAAWTFEKGHVARLELLPKDASTPAAPGNLTNYGRPSDGQQPVSVSDLVLRLPVAERPGALGGLVAKPSAKVLPGDRPDVKLARDYSGVGSISMAAYARSRNPVAGTPRLKGSPTARGKFVSLRITCPRAVDSCGRSRVVLRGNPKRKGARGEGVLIAKRTGVTVRPGPSKTLRVRLTAKARMILRRGPSALRVDVTITNGAGKTRRTLKLVRRGHVR